MQIRDLHVAAEGDRCLQDLRETVSIAHSTFADGVDFAFLTGDNANEGTAAQYRLIRRSLEGLALPLRIIAGDHDVAPGNRDAYRDVLGAHLLPRAETVRGVRCIFLDIVSAGSGGPDLRLGELQRTLLTQELAAAERLDLAVALFMHAFADLREADGEITALFAQHRVAVISTGHTHYNKIQIDGRTISIAVRLTGQVEEGPVGFALMAVEAGAIAWRFRMLQDPSPFCIVTVPTHPRLPTAGSCRIAAGPPLAMTWQAGRGTMSVWQEVVAVSPGRMGVTVLVEDGTGRTDEDTVTAWIDGAGPLPPMIRQGDGTARFSVGARPEKGIRGGQLGPNRNGRAW